MVEITGMPSASHTVATGLVVSGVEATSIRLISSSTINSCATCAARLGFDWLSLTITCTANPFSAATRVKVSMVNASASANPASGPDCGLT